MGDLRHSLVLVAVINRVKDLEILKGKGWYRIPVKYAPKRKPDYIAFYQTRVFGKEGRAIRYYASVKSSSVVKRLKLLPDEKGHSRAREYYYKFNLGIVRRTPRVLHNDSRRRISFGFTTLVKLRDHQDFAERFRLGGAQAPADVARRRKEAPKLEDIKLIDYDFKKYGSSAERKRLLAKWDAEVKSLPK